MNTTTIILAAGSINYTHLPVGTNTSNSMIPVNGKPVIGWILDDLLIKGIQQVAIVLRENDQRLRSYLEWAYASRMKLQIVTLVISNSIVESLHIGLQACKELLPLGHGLRVILGDTLITDTFTGNDFVYVSEVEESSRWCLVLVGQNSHITDYIDKCNVHMDQYLALAGYYHFSHAQCLADCVSQAMQGGERELSAVLRRYGQSYPLNAVHARLWYDFGNIDHLVQARRALHQARYFNKLQVNPVLNTLTKFSQRTETLQDELDWYIAIPEELKILTPRILSYQISNTEVRIVQEYYGYPTLAELYVYGELHPDTWRSILKLVLRIQQEFYKYKGQLEPSELKEMYLDKTELRLTELIEDDPAWIPLLNTETFIYNGRVLRGWSQLKKLLPAQVDTLVQNPLVSVIHGDFCFSNILFDIGNQIIRLIDPRGRFGRKGIYGDARYDLAKLRHSVCDYYDFIQADLFDFWQEENLAFSKIHINGVHTVAATQLDTLIQKVGYDLDEIRLIEGLLFISMLPIHRDQPKRQKLMFFTGLSLLNEVV